MRPLRSADRWLGLALFAGAVAFVVSLPNNLGEFDESLILYEARRVLHGEVLYRDVFEIITPGCLWIFAVLFHLFGETLTVARAGMAVVHGVIVVLVFATCRGLGVRRPLAAAAALAHLALGQPTWPYASPHWMGTLLQVLLVWLAVAPRWRGRVTTALLMGLTVGALGMVQQQKGVVMAAGAAVALAADALIERRGGRAVSWRALLGRELACAAGALAVAVPVMTVIVARAGVPAALVALVDYPLHHYTAVVSAPWGHVNFLNAQLATYTRPRLLAWLPLVLVLAAARGLAAGWRRDDAARGCIALLVLGCATIGSIAYQPDFIHLAIIAPVMFIAAAATLDWGLGWLRWRAAAPAITGLLLVALVAQLTQNWRHAWAEYPVAYQSNFGRIDLRDQRTAARIEQVRALVDASPTRELLAYPSLPTVYLVADARNPTPFQILSPLYNDSDTVQAAIDTLERRQVPLVVLVETFIAKDDPLARYVRDRYELVGDSGVWRRRP